MLILHPMKTLQRAVKLSPTWKIPAAVTAQLPRAYVKVCTMTSSSNIPSHTSLHAVMTAGHVSKGKPDSSGKSAILRNVNLPRSLEICLPSIISTCAIGTVNLASVTSLTS